MINPIFLSADQQWITERHLRRMKRRKPSLRTLSCPDHRGGSAPSLTGASCFLCSGKPLRSPFAYFQNVPMGLQKLLVNVSTNLCACLAGGTVFFHRFLSGLVVSPHVCNMCRGSTSLLESRRLQRLAVVSWGLAALTPVAPVLLGLLGCRRVPSSAARPPLGWRVQPCGVRSTSACRACASRPTSAAAPQ